MTDLRAVIDRIDADLVALLVRRQACIDRAVTLKQGEGMPARVPARVEDVLRKVRAEAQAQGLDPALADTLWRAMIEWAIAREAQVLGDTG
jgi:isochorismate pyruvate lyase